MTSIRSHEEISVDSPPQVPAPGTIADYASLLEAELARSWPADSDSLAAMARYALSAPGKMFRPVLLLESAQAVGGQLREVLPAATGTEYGHVASLIHDDIIDGDEMRRGQPAVYRKYGTDNAIVTGDALIFQLFVSLAECRYTGVPGDRIAAALAVVAASGVDLCRGQVLEAEITSQRILDIESYLIMISLKTAALFHGACKSGAILAGGPPEWIEALGEYGRKLGIAFQIRDDLLAYVGDATAMGKPMSSDIRNGRLTLPLILAYERGTGQDGAVLTAALEGAMDIGDAVEAVGEVLRRTGAIDDAVGFAREHAYQAQQALATLPNSPSRDRLTAFTELTVSRQH
jgi:geranylgeranyl pyrophosphate synthase